MKCVCCFFDSKNQSILKRNTFGIERFENKLENYKITYLHELNSLVPVDQCKCGYVTIDPVFLTWTNVFLENIKANISVIESTFDMLIKVYYDHIVSSQKNSMDAMWQFIMENNLATGSESPISYNQLLFRGRINDGKFNTHDPKEYFHIPFNKRYCIGNQRFSISGQPVLYLGKSVLGIEKELGKQYKDLVLAAFLPKYYIYYYKKIFELKNTIFDILVKVLPGLFAVGGKLDYFDTHYSPNINTIKNDIQRSILAEVLTFPVENKCTFVEEYVLPQILTSILMNNNYNGIVFPSTKDYSNLSNSHLFSDFNLNTALFVSYDKSSNYDQNLENTFFVLTTDGSEKFNLKPADILAQMEKVFVKNRTSSQNNNDFILPLVNTKLHMEYLEKAALNGKPYFETNEGKLELEFYLKLVSLMNEYVK